MGRAPQSLIAWLSVSLLLSAQSRPAPSQEPPTVVIKTTTHLVEINVVVHQHGQPVRGLTKDDFHVFDEGVPQQIRFFSIQENDAKPAPAPPLPKGVFSNRILQDGRSKGRLPLPNALTAVLIDTNGVPWNDQLMAKNSLLKLLSNIQADDRVAIYAMGPMGFRTLHDFSSDSASLVKALNRLKVHYPANANQSVWDMVADDPALPRGRARRTYATPAMSSARRDLAGSLPELTTLAYQMAGMPGRKSIVWVSASFDMGGAPSSYYSVSKALRLINALGVAVYPVDIRGLIGPLQLAPSLSAAGDTSASQVRSAIRELNTGLDKLAGDILTMNLVAERTGGVAYKNTNDIGGAVRKALDDGRVTYSVSYSPTHNEWNGQFRKIKVGFDRRGVEVRYRSGYLALDEDPDDPRVRSATLLAVAESPLLATELGIRVLTGSALPANVPRGELRIVLDGNDVAFDRASNSRWHVDLDLLELFFDDQGREIGRRSRSMTVSLSDQVHEAVEQHDMAFNSQIAIPKNTYRIRLTVRDVATGRVGSVNVPVT